MSSRRPAPDLVAGPPARGPARVAPGTRRDTGLPTALMLRFIGAVAGGGAPNLFTTLARHRLFLPWLWFASRLMPGGALPRRESELLILRIAHLCSCAYEWRQHAALAAKHGVGDADLARVVGGPDAAGWTPRETALLRATDELHATRSIGDATWSLLERHLDETERIELPMLVGHYEMLAMALNALQVEPDATTGVTGRLAWAFDRFKHEQPPMAPTGRFARHDEHARR